MKVTYIIESATLSGLGHSGPASPLRRFHYTSALSLWVVENAILVGLVTPDSLKQYLQVRPAVSGNSKDTSQASSLREAQSGKAERLV